MNKIPSSAAVNESVKIIKVSKQRFASGFVNAVLRKATQKQEELISTIINSDDLSFKYSCPKELVDELITDYGEQTANDFLFHSLESPKTYCRVNSVKFDLDDVYNSFDTNCINYIKTSLNGAFELVNTGTVEKLDEFKNGMFFVQDKSSQIAISSLDIKSGMQILDVCAAPGGKSFTSAQYVKVDGKVVSCHVYESRVNLINSGAKRLALEFVEAKVSDATVFNKDFGLFDRVVCDVPCSGIGVIRRKPEIKYKDINEFSDLFNIQLSILENSKYYLKPDGLIMYSTCTVRKAENEAVVLAFLKSNSEFEIVKQQTLMPQVDDCDGFYFCVLKRKNRG
jgi:16S rRNA (cytosine967-C5)-methyltransferase